ncbi:MAG: DUF3158 family protein [Candidatus Cloacimonetes bacterium]|nr:DUF3158 family protein [Candidatus Cloacimonadota bacterium]
MLRISLIFLIVAFVLSACAGGGSETADTPEQTIDLGDLLAIEQQRIELTVQPEIHLLLLRSHLTISAEKVANADHAYILLNRHAYIEEMLLNGRDVELHEVRVIKQKYFGEDISDSDWDRIAEFASLFRIDFPRKPVGGSLELSMKYNLRVTEEMTSCQFDTNEFILDGIGFWYPSNLQNDHPFHIEVTYPTQYSLEVLDNRSASEEVTPAMSRARFDLSGLDDPLLIIGYRE